MCMYIHTEIKTRKLKHGSNCNYWEAKVTRDKKLLDGKINIDGSKKSHLKKK